MAKEKSNKSLSLAHILCTIAFIALAFLLLCGFCYSGSELQMSILWTFVVIALLLLFLCMAIYLKKTKPYNKIVWKIVECGCVLAYIVVAYFTLKPIGTFWDAEIVEGKNIDSALEKDWQSVNALLDEFKTMHKGNLGHTRDGMKLILVTGIGTVDDLTKEFINDKCGLNDDLRRFDRHHINSYYENEENAIDDKKEEISNNYNEAYSLYKSSNWFLRPQRADKIKEQYQIVGTFNEEFVAEHKYPSFDSQQQYAIIDQESSLTIGESEFEKALEKVKWFNLISVIVVLIIHLFILIPYIVGVRQNVIRSVDLSGEDLGGRPLTVDN